MSGDSCTTRTNLSAVPRQSAKRMLLRNFRVPASIWERVEKAADEEGITPSEVVRMAVRDWLDRRR